MLERTCICASALSFTLVGLVVGAFGIGGLIYAAAVPHLVGRLGQNGLATFGGLLVGLAYLTLALAPRWWVAPIAVVAVGLGFYMLHNTLQTNATQMSPQARGTAVAIFSSALYVGPVARRARRVVSDRPRRRPGDLRDRRGVAACSGMLVCRDAAARASCARAPRARFPAVPAARPSVGRLLSSQCCSIGRSISFTRSSSVLEFCTSTVCASALNAESTAAAVDVGHDRLLRHRRRADGRWRRSWRLDSPRGWWRRRRLRGFLEHHIRLRVDLAEGRRRGSLHRRRQLQHVRFGLRLGLRRRCGFLIHEARHHRVDVVLLVPASRRGRGLRLRRRWGRRFRHRRRCRLWLGLGFDFCGGLGSVVVGDDPPDGGKNLLHGGFLRLRRLRHPPLSSRTLGRSCASREISRARHAICEDSPKYGTRKVERKRSPVDRLLATHNGLLGVRACT